MTNVTLSHDIKQNKTRKMIKKFRISQSRKKRKKMGTQSK